jgi:hypothetical protein
MIPPEPVDELSMLKTIAKTAAPGDREAWNRRINALTRMLVTQSQRPLSEAEGLTLTGIRGDIQQGISAAPTATAAATATTTAATTTTTTTTTTTSSGTPDPKVVAADGIYTRARVAGLNDKEATVIRTDVLKEMVKGTPIAEVERDADTYLQGLSAKAGKPKKKKDDATDIGVAPNPLKDPDEFASVDTGTISFMKVHKNPLVPLRSASDITKDLMNVMNAVKNGSMKELKAIFPTKSSDIRVQNVLKALAESTKTYPEMYTDFKEFTARMEDAAEDMSNFKTGRKKEWTDSRAWAK